MTSCDYKPVYEAVLCSKTETQKYNLNKQGTREKKILTVTILLGCIQRKIGQSGKYLRKYTIC